MSNLAYIVRDAAIPYITKDAKHILDHLASREGGNDGAWPSTATLSRCTNISLKGVQRAINCLIANALVVRTSGKAAGRVNHYRITLPQHYVDEWYAQHPKARREGHADPPRVGRGDEAGRPNAPAGVGQRDPRSESQLEEGKTNRQGNVDVGKSVSTCAQPPPDVVSLPHGKFVVAKMLAVKVCYEIGCTAEEAYKFWRYNQVRGWPLLATMELVEVARRWRDAWSKEQPDAYRTECERRREEKRRREEAELRRRIEAEDAAAENSGN